MNLAMAVRAASVEEKNRVAASRGTRMARSDMALRAESWVRDLQKPVIDRTVRLMTVGAVLDHRRVFPEKWPAPFCMAGVAVLIDTGLPQHGGVGRPVRIVTIRAGHLALAQGHVRGAHELGLPL